MNSHAGIVGEVSPLAKTNWYRHLLAVAGVVACILAMFQYEVVNAVQVWWIYPAYSHCFLIIPICAWLIWEKRDQLSLLTPAIAPKALLLIPLLLGVWLVGVVATVNEVRQFAVIGLVEAAILALLGLQVFRAILFPALYLLFLVPVGQYLIPPMQLLAAWFTDIGLNVLGIAHYSEGTFIDLPNARFEIAEACAGLRFLIATVALGVLFAHLSYRKWWKIAAFLTACIVVPLIANGFRCLGIVALAYYTNDAAAVEADHLIYGWGFNVAILLILMLGGMRFRDAPLPEAVALPGSKNSVPFAAMFATAFATVVLIAVGPAFSYWQENRPASTGQVALNFPDTHPGWNLVPFDASWYPYFPAPDQQFRVGLQSDSRGPVSVDAVVLYYDRIRAGRSLSNTTNHAWNGDIWRSVEERGFDSPLGSASARFVENTLISPKGRRLVWSTYWVGGQFVTSTLKIKLLQLLSIVTGYEAAALVAISTPIDGVIGDARARLASALGALNELPKRLDRSAGNRGELISSD